jgi:hypothetical protein
VPYTDTEIDDLAKRLWSQSKEHGDCILWKGPRAGKGYGVISWQGNQVYIHRLIFQLHNPDAILDVVRHSCDTPNCWHIEHLINGSTAENVEDKVAKLRHIFGENCHNAKFTDDDIRAIRASSLTIYQLGHTYNVTPSTIHYIRSGKTWKHVI